MKNLHNIERHPSKRGKYIGYAAGTTWTISKVARDKWLAYPTADMPHIIARTLTAVSEALAQIPEGHSV